MTALVCRPPDKGGASGFCERGVFFSQKPTPRSPSAHAPLFRGAKEARVHCVTSIALRTPSASMLKQIETMKIMVPGSAATQGLT